MNFKRIGRVAICLLLVCVLLFNIVSIEARATGIVETIIAGVSTVNVPVAIAIGATLIALGVCAGSDSASFNNVVSSAESWLGTQVGYVQDGFVKMVRVVDEAGEATYYAACDLFEGLRGWLFDTSVVSEIPYANTSFSVGINGSYQNYVFTLPVYVGYYTQLNTSYVFAYCPDMINGVSVTKCSYTVDSSTQVLNLTYNSDCDGFFRVIRQVTDGTVSGVPYLGSLTQSEVLSMLSSLYGTTSIQASDGLVLGQISTVPIDGTSAKAWANEYASKGLYVLQGGGSGQDPDDGAEGNNNWKWMLPLSLVTLLDLYAMSQADQWTGKTPAEFDEYTTSEEFDVTPQPDIDGYPAIEITPVVDPDTGGDTGGNTGADVDTDYTTWFQKVVDWLECIWEAITNIPDAIVNGIKTILQELFVPDPDFIPNKFEELCAEFAFADSIVRTAQSLNVSLAGITTEPPVIYIDLGSTRGSYDIGGKVPFIDMTWYAEYKPTADALISAFLWICFIWRMLIHLPGIIGGASGIFNLSPMPYTATVPISSLKTDPASGMTYSEMLNLYHQDLIDNPSWKSAFGRNPSFEDLQEIYSSGNADL